VLYRALCLCTILPHFVVSSFSDLGSWLALLYSWATSTHTFFLEADVIAENISQCYALDIANYWRFNTRQHFCMNIFNIFNMNFAKKFVCIICRPNRWPNYNRVTCINAAKSIPLLSQFTCKKCFKKQKFTIYEHAVK